MRGKACGRAAPWLPNQAAAQPELRLRSRKPRAPRTVRIHTHTPIAHDARPGAQHPTHGCAVGRAHRLRNADQPPPFKAGRTVWPTAKPPPRGPQSVPESPKRATRLEASTTRNAPEDAPPITARPAFSLKFLPSEAVSPDSCAGCAGPPPTAAPDGSDLGVRCSLRTIPPRAVSKRPRPGQGRRTGRWRTQGLARQLGLSRPALSRFMAADAGTCVLDPPLVRVGVRRFRRWRRTAERAGHGRTPADAAGVCVEAKRSESGTVIQGLAASPHQATSRRCTA